MCGISLYIDNNKTHIDLKHRGPDDHQCVYAHGHSFVFDRLSINDTSIRGKQPFITNDNISMCNGEIYNYSMLRKYHDLMTISDSDCEVLHCMLVNSKKTYSDLLRIFDSIDGVFALVFVDGSNVIAARDPLGVRPLYIAYDVNKNIIGFSSECKGFLSIESNIHTIEHFPPGHFYLNGEFIEYQPINWLKKRNSICSLYDPTHKEEVVNKVRTLMIEAVYKRITNTSRPVGFFLSGGLDSSIVASIAAKLLYPHKITVYSVGTKNQTSPDIEAAKQVAKHINAEHIIYEFEPEDLKQNYLEKTMKAIESYDCTTVRASVPMYYMSEQISQHTFHKVILSGEGADELFGGYLYFHNAPTNEEFQEETIRRLKEIHMYDSLRADRCTAAHGLELRVPFLDKTLVNYVTQLSPTYKSMTNNTIEKQILREAFHDFLPDNILYRQKNGMSDAVGYTWVDYLRLCKPLSPNTEYAINPPTSDEERYYREKFEADYGHMHPVTHTGVWRPKWTNVLDPSATLLSNFVKND